MGGHVEAPSYEQVSSQTSGHLETVRVRFDPARVSYEAVAKRFFEIHDPTQANGQGPDIGPEYVSAVFYVDADQKRTTEGLIARLEARGYDIVTEVRLPESIVCNSTLWAACIGGAAQQDDYRSRIERSGLAVTRLEDNPAYQFISDNARGASSRFGVRSISLLAVKC